jgi:hypothetical protein
LDINQDTFLSPRLTPSSDINSSQLFASTMISFGNRNIIRLLFGLLLLNIICALYDQSRIRQPPPVVNNQRSADSGYRYAWFTRDIPDDDDEVNQQSARSKMLKNMFHRKYPNSNEYLSD